MFPSNLSWDEFLALPQETRNAALIDGEVVVNPPNAQHQRIVRNLEKFFGQWMEAAPGRGEVSTQQPVKVNDRRGYQPDFAWYPEDQCSAPDEPAAFDGLPALIVEVLSPSTRSFDLLRKRTDYERLGIRELWFVDPVLRTVLIYRYADPDTAIELGLDEKVTSPLLDGIALAVHALVHR
jgi:Uma2 family endonuclease